MRRVLVDQEKCVGCGTCEGLCPDIFQLDEEAGKSTVIMQGGDEACIEEAIASCPAEAISWEEA